VNGVSVFPSPLCVLSVSVCFVLVLAVWRAVGLSLMENELKT